MTDRRSPAVHCLIPGCVFVGHWPGGYCPLHAAEDGTDPHRKGNRHDEETH